MQGNRTLTLKSLAERLSIIDKELYVTQKAVEADDTASPHLKKSLLDFRYESVRSVEISALNDEKTLVDQIFEYKKVAERSKDLAEGDPQLQEDTRKAVLNSYLLVSELEGEIKASWSN